MGSKRYKFSRYAMYNSIENHLRKLKLKPGKAILIGDSLRGKSKNLRQIQNTALTDMLPKGCDIIAPPYPDVDIQSMPYEDESFDYVLSDQVLEHVRKPWVATEEVRRILKKGGLAIMTTCLTHPIHGLPDDYFRFTPFGLEVLFENFEKIHLCDGSGNLQMVIDCFQGGRGGRVKAGTPRERKAVSNDGKNLLHVWIIAQK
jgi:SAM-dependent methyltransferase